MLATNAQNFFWERMVWYTEIFQISLSFSSPESRQILGKFLLHSSFQ